MHAPLWELQTTSLSRILQANPKRHPDLGWSRIIEAVLSADALKHKELIYRDYEDQDDKHDYQLKTTFIQRKVGTFLLPADRHMHRLRPAVVGLSRSPRGS